MHNKIPGFFPALLCLALSSAASAQEAIRSDQIARGLLMQHGEKLIFSPCRERTYVEVNDVSNDGIVSQALTKLGLSEKSPLYVEFVGQVDGGRLKASFVNFASTQARCQSSTASDEKWRGFGTAPNWSLSIGEHFAALSREGAPKQTLGEITPSIEGEMVRFQLPEAQGQWIFRRGLCQQGEGTMLFGWVAELQQRTGTLRGCAWRGY